MQIVLILNSRGRTYDDGANPLLPSAGRLQRAEDPLRESVTEQA